MSYILREYDTNEIRDLAAFSEIVPTKEGNKLSFESLLKIILSGQRIQDYYSFKIAYKYIDTKHRVGSNPNRDIYGYVDEDILNLIWPEEFSKVNKKYKIVKEIKEILEKNNCKLACELKVEIK